MLSMWRMLTRERCLSADLTPIARPAHLRGRSRAGLLARPTLPPAVRPLLGSRPISFPWSRADSLRWPRAPSLPLQAAPAPDKLSAMTALLADCLAADGPQEACRAAMLARGRVAPAHESRPTGMGAAALAGAIAQAFGSDVQTVQAEASSAGGLAAAAAALWRAPAAPSGGSAESPAVSTAELALLAERLGAVSGTGATQSRVDMVSELLSRCGSAEAASVVVRVAHGPGAMRTGVGDVAVVTALALAARRHSLGNAQGLEGSAPSSGFADRTAGAPSPEQSAAGDTQAGSAGVHALGPGAGDCCDEAPAAASLQDIARHFAVEPDLRYIVDAALAAARADRSAGSDRERKDLRPEDRWRGVGVPVGAMLGVAARSADDAAARVQGWSEASGGWVAADWKADGERVQVHVSAEGGRVFSRNGEDSTAKFGALAESLWAAADAAARAHGKAVTPFVVDGEAVLLEEVREGDAGQGAVWPRAIAADRGAFRLMPFREVARLARKGTSLHEQRGTDNEGGEVASGSGSSGGSAGPARKLGVVVFDLLFSEGAGLLSLPLRKRRERLGGLFAGNTGFATGVALAPGVDVEASADGVRLSRRSANGWGGASRTGGAESSECLAAALRNEALLAAAHGGEGLMLKPLDKGSAARKGAASGAADPAEYRPATRSTSWVKLKVDAQGVRSRAPAADAAVGGDTLDLIVVGAFRGKGRRAKGPGAFLVGCLADERGGETGRGGSRTTPEARPLEVVPVARIGTGLSDADLERFGERVRAAEAAGEAGPEPPGWVRLPKRLSKARAPHVWLHDATTFPPWEVKATEATPSAEYEAGSFARQAQDGAGFSLRFPRLVRERPDKPHERASTEADVVALSEQDRCDGQARRA